MFVRTTHAKFGDKTYNHIKIVESYREMGRVKQRVVASLGSMERFAQSDVDNIINGLCKIFGKSLPELPTQFDETPSYGDVHAIISVWHELKIAQVLQRHAQSSRSKFDLEQHVKLMVMNRLCDPKSKLALLIWLETVYLPGVDRSEVKYENLLRAMDWLIENKDQIEAEIAQETITLFDKDLDLVFYDLTSSYFETELTDELRKYGFSRDHRADRPQVTIGMVMTRSGIPIYHQTFPGNTLDKTTVQQVVKDLKARFPITRAVFVGDRGMLSRDNIEVIRAEGLDYIVAVNLRNDSDAEDLVYDFQYEVDEARVRWEQELQQYGQTGKLPNGITSEEALYESHRLFGDAVINGRRLVIEHGETVARQSKDQRDKRFDRTEGGIKLVIGKLETQDRGKGRRGRKLTESGALIQISEIVKRNRLGTAYKLDIQDERVSVVFDESALEWEKILDGKLVVETSLIDMKPEDVIRQYRELRQIEDAFRTLKSSLEIHPMHHWKPHRIKAHVFICMLALVIERAMRHRLLTAGETTKPERVLEKLRMLRAVSARTTTGSVRGLTTPTPEQRELFCKLGVPIPDWKDVAKA